MATTSLVRLRHVYLFLCVIGVFGPPFAARAANGNLTEQLVQLEHTDGARVGIAATRSGQHPQVEYRAQERFPMCSTFKLLAVAAVLKHVDENKENLGRFVPYGEAQLQAYAPVTRAHLKDGGMSLRDLCAAAIEQSDNTAGNLLLEAIGGPKSVTAFARALGDNFTRLDRNEPDLNNATPGDDRDTTTPAAMCNDLQRLLTSDFLSVASRARLESWLRDNQTGMTMIRASVPSDWSVADKTGRSVNGVTNDVAVVRPPTGPPMFLAIFTRASGLPTEKRDSVVAEVAKASIQVLNK